ncbi:MAG: hypothetical protein M3O01_03345 [Pseudomonadota bacterium]|nr:hypothetical protein [Pseudomonadota bacterium]
MDTGHRQRVRRGSAAAFSKASRACRSTCARAGRLGVAAATLLCSVMGAAFASDHPAAHGLTELNAPAPFTREDAVATDSRGSAGTNLRTTELQRRFWLTRGPLDLGWGFGAYSWGAGPGDAAPARGSIGPAGMGSGTATVLTIGMRYRTSTRSAVFADASQLYGGGWSGAETTAGKVGFELRSSRSFLHVAYGGLGLRLAGDTGLTVRPRRGGLGVFVRHAF